ncbi:hypothetical protein TYM08_P3748 [Marinicellulosiphila megalodicopiae]
MFKSKDIRFLRNLGVAGPLAFSNLSVASIGNGYDIIYNGDSDPFGISTGLSDYDW